MLSPNANKGVVGLCIFEVPLLLVQNYVERFLPIEASTTQQPIVTVERVRREEHILAGQVLLGLADKVLVVSCFIGGGLLQNELLEFYRFGDLKQLFLGKA